MAAPKGWLLVSKPLRPPFRDGSTVLVRTLAQALPVEHPLTYFGNPLEPLRDAKGDQVLAAAAMGYAPGFLGKLRVLGSLMHPGRRRQPVHLFFTPNRVTSTVLSVLRRLQPRRPLVQSVMSSQEAGRFAPLLSSLDAVVTLSDHTKKQLIDAGLDASRVHRIYPAVAAQPPSAGDVAKHRRLLFAGDLDGDVARHLSALGLALAEERFANWTLTIAARPKGDNDSVHRERLAAQLATQIEAGRVELLAEVPDMGTLLSQSSLQLYLAAHVRRKVDLPLVLLEGMSRGVGLLSLDFAPVNEIYQRAKANGLEVGATVSTQAEPAQVVEAVAAAIKLPEVLTRWGVQARQLVDLEFGADRMAEQFMKLYGHLERKE